MDIFIEYNNTKNGKKKRKRRKEKKRYKEDSNPHLRLDATTTYRYTESALHHKGRLCNFREKSFNFIPFAWNFLNSDKKKQRNSVIQSSNVVMSGKPKSRKAQVEFR